MSQNVPPLVRQTRQDSCWAAVLESWSRADRRMPQGLQQQQLIDQWGEGPTGGINPEVKIPRIAAAYGLQVPRESFRFVLSYLERHLDSSYVFCASSVPGSIYMHSVLVYGIRGSNILTMDPDRGRLHPWNIGEFENLGAHVVMHRP